MKTVKEVSRLTGISVRTLHHYDAIGLLKPAQVTESGYRLYDNAALARLQTILLFRQLRFPLKEIKEILDLPGFDPMEALNQQIELLELQRNQLDDIIAHARQIQQTGVYTMNFKAFDTATQERYAAEAKAKWGKTDAYKEFQQRGSQDQQSAAEGLMSIFAEMGRIKDLAPESSAAQALIAKLQGYITDHFYTCTPQILRGLGQLYIAGDEMTRNIDAAGGPGTADFAHRAIEIFCK